MKTYPLIVCVNQTTLGDFVSIGIAAFIGRDLYLETKEGWDIRDLPSDKKEEVLASLDSGYVVPLAQIGELLFRYLSKYGTVPVQAYSDTPKEAARLLKKHLPSWPENLSPTVTPLYPTSSPSFESAYRRCFGNFASEYQALDRAQALRMAFTEIRKR